MNSTSQNPGHKFPFSSGHNAMDDRALIATLAVSVGVAFVLTLVLYASLGGNPLHRLGYGVLMSVTPALAAVALLKLTRLFVSRLGAVFIYAVLFIIVLIIQVVGRFIPVYS